MSDVFVNGRWVKIRRVVKLDTNINANVANEIAALLVRTPTDDMTSGQ